MARLSTRTAILDATEELARTVGLVRVTTKAVASAAGCSEASIYYHFHDRADLLAEVVAGRMKQVNAELATMPLPEGDTATRISALIKAVAAAYTNLIALSSPLLADPEVLGRLRAVMEQHSVSLHGMQAIVAERIGQEQQAGRVRSDVDPVMVALVIAGTCHEIALEGHLMGLAHQHLESASSTVQSLANTLSTLLEES
ncbi:MAG TPA: TetR/AcrR family transcriptional regulator [Propionibacteriaceae bacterium]|nr:TetR/AcrR family transcriptional regulator [Propionibacteriaceae bacterium]